MEKGFPSRPPLMGPLPMGSAASRAEDDAAADGDEDALVNRILSACRPAFADADASPQEQADAVLRLAEVRARAAGEAHRRTCQCAFVHLRARAARALPLCPPLRD